MDRKSGSNSGAWIGFLGSIVGAIVGGFFALRAGDESQAAATARQQAVAAKTEALAAKKQAENAEARTLEIRQELDDLVKALETPLTAPAGVSVQVGEWRTCKLTTLVSTTVSFPNADGNANFDCFIREKDGSKGLKLPPIFGGPNENPYPSTTFCVPAGWQYIISANTISNGSKTAFPLAIESYFRVQ